jgi:hypothetical protein
MHSGHGTGFTIQSTSQNVAGTTLVDIPNPQPNDEVRIVLDETHSDQSCRGTGFLPITTVTISATGCLATAGSTRDFYTRPIQTGEIEGKAVTDAKIDDCTTDTAITESNAKFSGCTKFSFSELKQAIIAKINALFSNKVDKVSGNYKIYGCCACCSITFCSSFYIFNSLYYIRTKFPAQRYVK